MLFSHLAYVKQKIQKKQHKTLADGISVYMYQSLKAFIGQTLDNTRWMISALSSIREIIVFYLFPVCYNREMKCAV